MLIVTTYQNIGIHVDRVVGIYRVSSENILSPGKDLTTSNKQAISGILKIDDRTIEILDIETILRDINPDIKSHKFGTSKGMDIWQPANCEKKIPKGNQFCDDCKIRLTPYKMNLILTVY